MSRFQFDLLAKNLSTDTRAFRPEGGARLSTVDQAWSAILLKAGLIGEHAVGAGSRLLYFFLRTRRPSWFLDTGFPILSMLIVIALSSLVTYFNRNSPTHSVLADIIAPLAVFLVGSLYGPKYFQRLLPGRE